MHFIADDRSTGDHVPDLTVGAGRLALDPCDDLHVELPRGVRIGTASRAAAAAIARIETDAPEG